MKIIALTDIHGHLGYLPQIAPQLAGADLVLIAGDLTTFGGEPSKRTSSRIPGNSPLVSVTCLPPECGGRICNSPKPVKSYFLLLFSC